MNFLRKLTTQANTTSTSTGTPSIGLGSGRRLRSDLPLADCVAHLKAIVAGYEPPNGTLVESIPYREPLVTPGWRWGGRPSEQPSQVVYFHDGGGEATFAAFTPIAEGGTQIGIFPLGTGDQRLTPMPITGHWKQRDASLTSTGTIPAEQLIVLPPPAPENLADDILTTSGYAFTFDNVLAVMMNCRRLILFIAHQFIASEDPRRADQFVKSHSDSDIDDIDRSVRGNGGNAERDYYQNVLDDLGRWNPVVLFYIQDLPMKVRAITLTAIVTTGTIGGTTLER